jgi:hypothetical protein
MKYDCFYRVTVTQNDRDTEWYWGRFPYTAVIRSVEQLYSDGAAAVELEQITPQEFYEQMPRG